MSGGYRGKHAFEGVPGENDWQGKPTSCSRCPLPPGHAVHDLSQLDLTDRSAAILGEDPDRDDELAARRASTKAASPGRPGRRRPRRRGR